MMSDHVSVRVPGSTSNCGAGFDTLGLALRIYNRVTLTRRADARFVAERECDARAQAMVTEAAAEFARSTGDGAPGFNYRIEGDVPTARGLGSSITVIGGVLGGLNALTARGCSADDLVAMATTLEGHPDNAAAGILGGFCVARCQPESGRYAGTLRFAVPESVAFVVTSPALETLTKESRGTLPRELPYAHAVRSINSATYVVAALASGNYEALRGAVSDYMHEPYRLPRIPGGRAAIDAGVAAGAYTGWLSGSGSSVLCVAPLGSANAVGEAMKAAFTSAGLASEARVLAADNTGLVVETR